MFGIEFSELVIIAIVALIVIGPEQLPKVARTVGHLWGRLQRYVNSVKADMSREMALEELRKVQREAQNAAADLQQSIHQAGQEVEKSVASMESEIASSGYGLGQSIPASELDRPVLPREELLKSEAAPAIPPAPATSETPAAQPRHVILEDHHAVMPDGVEVKKTS